MLRCMDNSEEEGGSSRIAIDGQRATTDWVRRNVDAW